MKADGFHEYIMHEVFGGIPGIISKRMFGGYGIYKDGIIFAIIAEGTLYFKVGEANKKDFDEHGAQAFRYLSKNRKEVTMSYRELPAEIIEDKDEIAMWVTKAVEVSKNR